MVVDIRNVLLIGWMEVYMLYIHLAFNPSTLFSMNYTMHAFHMGCA